MRLLQKLKQYQRVYRKFGMEATLITAADLAVLLLCSDRHVRNLLKQLCESGWITWKSQPGRGHKAVLQCRINYETLSSSILDELLIKGDYQSALQLAEGNPVYLNHIISPFLGGKWLKDMPTLRIPYYRALGRLTPGLMLGRAETHMVTSIYSRLTKFEHSKLVGDLCYRWEQLNEGKVWGFYLRNDLYWHNGQPIKPSQIIDCIKNAWEKDKIKQSFSHVKSISLIGSFYLKVELFVADIFFPERMSNPALSIYHPSKKEIGCGPFRLVNHESHYIRLEKHAYYHLNHPIIYAIELWNTGGCISKEHNPASISIGDKKPSSITKATISEEGKSFSYMAFNKTTKINKTGKKKIIQQCQEYILNYYKDCQHILPFGDIVSRYCGHALPREKYPKTVTVAFIDTLELRDIATFIDKTLSKHGCEVKLLPKSHSKWMKGLKLKDADIYLTECTVGSDYHLSLEECFLYMPEWKFIVSPKYQNSYKKNIMGKATEKSKYRTQIEDIYNAAIRNGLFCPLIKYNYRINLLTQVEGVNIQHSGWFDFSTVWIP